jgi:hypothetical protein
MSAASTIFQTELFMKHAGLVTSAGGSETRPGVSSASYNPTATDWQRDTRRVGGLVRPPPATAILAALYRPAGRFETAPTGAAVERLVLGWVCFHASLSAAPRRLNDLGGHPKSGHMWSLQNRPTETLRDRSFLPNRHRQSQEISAPAATEVDIN